MVDIVADEELNQWFSTYGAITAQRLLSKYNINLPSEDLLAAIKTPYSFYHQILQIPLKNVLNGIILQQANDYHVYAQKLFIDYLLSGESGKEPAAQGAMTREAMENERQKLVVLGEEYHKKQVEQDYLIATSQASLIAFAKEWQTAFESGITKVNATLKHHNHDIKKSVIRKAINQGLIYSSLAHASANLVFIEKMNDVMQLDSVKEMENELLNNLNDLLTNILNFSAKFDDFFEKIEEMREQAHSYRTQFYEAILRVAELIKLLPDYKIDPAQDAINREPLYFDKTIGDAK